MDLILAICCLLVVCSHVTALTKEEIGILEQNGVNVTRNGPYYMIESTGLPQHPTQSVNPHSAQEQAFDFYVAIDPIPLAKPGCLPMGVIGFVANGVAIYNPYTADGYNAVEGENKETFDECHGHPDPFGRYHYHELAGCIFTEISNTTYAADQFIGVALDGYPIYGPNTVENGIEKILSHRDLDECNGHTVNGLYWYRMTSDFPYYLGCYKGYVDADRIPTPPAGRPPEGTPPAGRPPEGAPPAGRPPQGRPPTGSQCFYAYEKNPTGFNSLISGTLNNGESYDLNAGARSTEWISHSCIVFTGSIVFAMHL